MTYTTELTEDAVLDYFYTMARNQEVDRVALLKQLADVAIARPREWDRTAVRLAMAGVKVKLTSQGCWCCRNDERWLYWHHVIGVNNGGSSGPRNVVPICHACHRRVHPWLKPGTTVENRRGWTMVGDLASRALDALVAWWDGKTPKSLQKRKQVLED